MLKMIIIALITMLLSIVFKKQSGEFSMMINIAGGLIILFLTFDYISELFSYYINLSSNIGIDNSIIKTAVKVISIGYLSEFVSDLAVDFGNNVIASKIIFGGKVVICLIILPVVKELVSLLFSFY